MGKMNVYAKIVIQNLTI